MQSFVLNRNGRLVFPSNVFPELDFSVIRDQDQLDQVVRRDFETKAPTGTEMLRRIETGTYADRYQLMRDMALNLFWTNRFAATMYDKQPTRWRDVPRRRDDVFLPVLTPWDEGERKVAAVESAYRTLPVAWDAEAEARIFSMLFDVFRHRRHHATELPALKPTVAEALASPENLTFHLLPYDPDYPRYGDEEILNVRQEVPELEALHRWAMVLHNQYPWDRAQVRLTQVGQLNDDDHVVLFLPRNREVARFLREARAGSRPAGRRTAATTVETREPVRPYPAIHVATQFRVQPRIEALAVVKGEQPCTNEDLIRNSSYSWSPMSAEQISKKTGIQQRLYTERDLEDIALEAARAALAHAGREPQEIGAVIVCSCTSTRMMPSVATWLSGELGMYQTHGSADIVAACAGLPYGLAEATRLLQEVERPVLVVCAEKFSDKIGNVRPSRMMFGDGAAAIVIAPAGSPAATCPR
jgi:3-oxoacyl-[acyl-carrier-protein] synthase-3